MGFNSGFKGLNETVQDIPGQAHFIDVASHQLASYHNSANHMMYCSCP